MRSALFQIITGVSVLAAYALQRWKDPRRMARRSMGGLTATPIAQLTEGEQSRVCGVVEGVGAPLSSPVDRQSCIGFRLLIDRRKAGGSGETWFSVVKREGCQPFRIRDDSGEATVEGPFLFGLDVDDGGWAGLPREVYDILDEAQVSMDAGFAGDYEFRFSLALLKPGDRISLLGSATRELDPGGSSAGHRSPPFTWHFKGTSRDPIALTDEDDPAPV